MTAFSLDYLTVTAQEETGKYILIALAGLVFNGFLTLAFLRDHAASAAPAKAAKPVHQFAS